MDDRRDTELGAALRQLEVPAHDPSFFPRLDQRLVEEEAARRSGRSSAPPRWRRPTMLLTVAAAVVALVLIVDSALPGGGKGPGLVGPRVAIAAEVRTRVASAFASTRTLRGVLTIECAVSLLNCQPPDGDQGRTTTRWSVVAAANGDERLTPIDTSAAGGGSGGGGGGGGGGDTAYRADQQIEQSAGAPSQAGTEFTDLPAGPPDFTRRSPLGREYASVVRAFLDSGTDAPVTETSADGRRAWQLSVAVQPNKLAGPGRSPDRIDIVVDQATGFPLRVTATLAGRFLYETRLSDLTINAPVDASAFVIPTTGAKVLHMDYGFHIEPLDQVAGVVGYQPVLPSYLPPGYRMTQLSVAHQAQATGTEGLNPPSTNIVSAAYRRGFDLIVVTTRRTGADPSAWYDPMGTAEGVADQPDQFTVSQGALSGAAASVVITPGGTPHVWTVDSRLVVTVSGDATHEELVHMIASMQ